MNTLNIFKVSVAVLMGIASICSAVEGTWTRKIDMPTARLGLSANTVNGKIYAIGGGYNIEGPSLRTVEEYDPIILVQRETDIVHLRLIEYLAFGKEVFLGIREFWLTISRKCAGRPV